MNDVVVPTMVHRITTVHSGARRSSRALAACPREHDSVDVVECATCPNARGFVGGSEDAATTRGLLCALDRTEIIQSEPTSVGALMRREVVCVRQGVAIDDIVHLFIERNIGGVPVVDAYDRPIGMISKTDLVSIYARRGLRTGELLDSFDADIAADEEPTCARDVMSRVVFTLREHESIMRAAELFAAEHVHRAPVVNVEGKVVGVLTSFDIVRAIADGAGGHVMGRHP